MKHVNTLIAGCLLAGGGAAAYAQDQAGSDKFVTREEYNKLLKQNEEMRTQLQEVLKQLSLHPTNTGLPASTTSTNLATQVQDLQKQVAAQKAETDQALDDIDKQMKGVKATAKESFPGSSKMMLAGYGSATFIAPRAGFAPAQPTAGADVPTLGKPGFTATFNPIFLWKMSDRLLFEGEMELELQSAGGGVPTGATTALEMAQLSYLLNDYMTIGAGKFLNPMDYFVERQHMAWVNKLPDKPLAVYDGLLPESLLGAQIRGGVPVGPTRFGYAFYVANAPSLTLADSGSLATRLVGDAGQLAFDDFNNTFGHFATGGRVGFFPLPELELGYGFQVGQVGLPGSDVGALFQSADLTYVKEIDPIKGTLNFHAQYVWSHIDSYAGYTDSAGTALTPFTNNRDGGYFQLAYRPTKLTSFIKNFEPVFRYDMLNQLNTPVGFDDRRYTVGLNYWLGPSTVIKTAYEFDRQNGTGTSGNAFFLQFATGF